MKHFLITLSICLLASTAYGTKQEPEKILYNGQEYGLANVPLEKYFDVNHPKPVELHQTRTSLWRGYVGTWEIKDETLYLKSLGRHRNRSMQEIPLSLVFKGQKAPIKATWYTGVLRIPLGEMLQTARMMVYSGHYDEDLHAGFQRADYFDIYERDLYIRVEQGSIISEHLVDNKEKGATQSIRDWGWVMSGSGPVKDDFKWHDLRDVVSEVFSQYKESGKSFRTRGIFWTDNKNEKATLWIPATPATEPVWIQSMSMPKNYAGKTGEHLEIKAHFEKEPAGFSLHVDSACPLIPGETMHHPEFKPPNKAQLTTERLAIARLEYKDKAKIEYLANDYGFLIQWLDNRSPKLFIYNKPAKSIRMTRNFNVFLKYLQAFPSGAKVDRKRGCGITALGMTEDHKKRLEQVIKDKQFYLTDVNDGNYGVCTCETLKVTWFTSAKRGL